MGWLDDLSKLGELGKRVAENVMDKQDETLMHKDVKKPADPYIVFKCNCGYRRRWLVKDHTPSQLMEYVTSHVNSCPNARETL